MYDVFLCYARAQNSDLASEIYQRLSDSGLQVWWDQQCMPSRSLTFLQEIRLAVRDARRTVVLLDESACESDYVRAEWQYALAAGKAVIPLMRLEDYDQLPAELAGLHAPDFTADRPLDAAVAELQRLLRQPLPPLGPLLGQVPDIPPHYQPRTGATSQLAALVMAGRTSPETVTGAARITVLHGMGGSGKSVMAAALARSTAVRQAFDDGIVWLSSEQDAAPATLLRGIGSALGLDTQGWRGARECTAGALKALLQRRLLLVVDNANALAVLEPLLGVMDTDTRVLVTTRLAGLASDLGGRSLALGDLQAAEAIQLLADWAGSAPDSLPAEAASLAAACGYLPFALAINGAMVRRGMPWSDLLEAIEDHELDFARAQQSLGDYPYRDVFRCIRPSVDELQSSDPQAAGLLADLAAFHWEQGVPEAAITSFWQSRGCSSARLTRRVLVDLADRSLLRLEGEYPDRRVQLHDIQLDYLIASGADPLLLGGKLLHSYGPLEAAAPDGYIHQHAVRHLLQLQDFGALQLLLDGSGSAGGNSWFAAAEAADNLGGYLEDLDRAAAAWPDGAPGLRSALGMQLHCGLLRASVNSLSSMLSEVIRALMRREGPWSSARALTEARQVADVDRRIRALLIVAPELQDKDATEAVQEALALARTRGNQALADHLICAARVLEGAQREALLREAIEVARSIELPGYRAEALVAVAAECDDTRRRALAAEAFAEVQEELASADVNSGGFYGLGQLARLLPQTAMPDLFDLIRAIPNNFSRAAAFATCVGCVEDNLLQQQLVQQGLDCEQDVARNSDWIRISLLQRRAGYDAQALFDETLASDDRQVAHLLRSAPVMDIAEACQWLSRIDSAGFRSEDSRFKALLVLLDHFEGPAAESLLQRLLQDAGQLPYDSWRRAAFEDLALYLKPPQLQYAVSRIRELGDGYAIGSALVSLLPLISPSLQQQALDFLAQSADCDDSLDLLVAAAEAPQHKSANTPLLPQQQVWELAVPAAIDAISRRPAVTAELLPTILDAEVPALRQTWEQLDLRLRSLKRQDLCDRYTVLLPLLRTIGGPGLCDELAASLLAIAGWYP